MKRKYIMDYLEQYRWLPNFKIIEFKEQPNWKDVIRLVVHIEDRDGLFKGLSRVAHIDLHYGSFQYKNGIKTNILLKDWCENNLPNINKISSPITPMLYESKLWAHIFNSPYSDTEGFTNTKENFRKLNINYLYIYIELFFDILRKNYNCKFSVALNRQLTIKKLLK